MLKPLFFRRSRSTPVALPPGLRILIVSTPKTGNTWLKHLLAAVYNLPMVTPAMTFDVAEFARFGPSWVAHQHYSPRSEILEWAECNDVHLLTTLRHPGDVLISLYHYVKNTQGGEKFGPGVELLLADSEKIGAHTRQYVETFFFTVLHSSVEWLLAGRSRIVRYEALWRDPLATLAEVSREIKPVSQDALERAVEQSALDLLSQQHPASRFFRQGGEGQWTRDLTPEILAAFRQPPYAAQFVALGYSLDPPATDRVLERKDVASRSPFRQISHFDNGVPFPAAAVRCYLSFETEVARQRWPDVSDTRSPGSFFAWLNAPPDEDPKRQDSSQPQLSNLTMRLYRDRYDLVVAFPDIFGQDRIKWLLWLLSHYRAEFRLDDIFIKPIRQSLLSWSGTVVPERFGLGIDLPPLTNLALHVYAQRRDMQKILTDIYGQQRVDYLLWFLNNAAPDMGFDPELTRPTRGLFTAWANEPDPGDRNRPRNMPAISRWAAHEYRKQAQYRKKFPDAYGQDRMDFLMTFVAERTWFAEAVQGIVEAWAGCCLAAVSPE